MANSRDLFKELGIQPPQAQGMSPAPGGNNQPRDLFSELGIKPPPQSTNRQATNRPPMMFSPEDMERRKRQLSESGIGAGQGVLNSMIGIANLLPKVNIPKAHYAPDTEYSRRGELAGDIGSYFLPGGAFKAIKGVKPTLKAIESASPAINAILRNLGQGAQAGIFSASHAPEGQRVHEGEKGAAIGSALDVLGRALHIPYLGNLLSGGAGYLAGQQVGHPYIGAEAGLAAPQALKYLMSGNKNAMAEQMLAGLDKNDVARSAEAAQRIGIRLRPSEASGNPITAGIEAQPRKTVAGAQEHIRQEMGREHEQQNAIRNLLDKIYKPTPENKNAISSLYKKAYKHDLELPELNTVVEMPLKKSPILNEKGVNFETEVPPKVENKTMEYLKSGPILKEAFGNVGRNSAFSDIPENNYEYLHAVSRELQRMKKGARDGNESFRIGQVQENFNKLIKNENPDFAAAQKAAQPKLQREGIEQKINEDVENEKVTGKDFYNKVLKRYDNYKELVKSLKNNPEARQALKDMRISFKNMSKLPTVGTTAEQQAKGYTSLRETFTAMVHKMKDIAGGNPDIAKIKYINSGQWMKDFDKLKEIKDSREYNKKLLNLVSRVGLAYGLSPDSAENLTKAISE